MDPEKYSEAGVIDKFNYDLLPFLKKHGAQIGDKAMQGDRTAELLIRRYRSFEGWQTYWSLKALESSMKLWARENEL